MGIKFTPAVETVWKKGTPHLHCRFILHVSDQVGDDVMLHPDRHSLLAVPHPFIVPGGRFREFYYWWEYSKLNTNSHVIFKLTGTVTGSFKGCWSVIWQILPVEWLRTWRTSSTSMFLLITCTTKPQLLSSPLLLLFPSPILFQGMVWFPMEVECTTHDVVNLLFLLRWYGCITQQLVTQALSVSYYHHLIESISFGWLTEPCLSAPVDPLVLLCSISTELTLPHHGEYGDWDDVSYYSLNIVFRPESYREDLVLASQTQNG